MNEETDIKKRIEPLVLRLNEFNQEPEEGKVEEMVSLLCADGSASIPLIEAILSELKAKREQILTDDIPCLLAEYGMSEAMLLDGTKIGTEMYYSTSQTDKDPALMAEWLEANGYGDVIKDTIKMGKGEFDERLKIFLEDSGYSYEKDSSVHPQTLKSTIRKHIESGGELPPKEAVEVKMYQRAKIVPPKQAKGF